VSGSGGAVPEAIDQIAGLTFAMLVVAPDMTIHSANPAAENLLGRSARRLIDGVTDSAGADSATPVSATEVSSRSSVMVANPPVPWSIFILLCKNRTPTPIMQDSRLPKRA
jgi:nitrogen-specific signal transduction histidine kinase